MHRARLRSTTWRTKSLPAKRVYPPVAEDTIIVTRPKSSNSQSVSGASDAPLTGNLSQRMSVASDITTEGGDSRNDTGSSKASKYLNYIGIFLIIIGALPLIIGVSRYVSPSTSIAIGAGIAGFGIFLILCVCWCSYVCQNVEDRIPMRHPKIVDSLRKASIASQEDAFRRAVVNSPKIVVEMVHEITDPHSPSYYSSNNIPNNVPNNYSLSPKKPRSPRKCSL